MCASNALTTKMKNRCEKHEKFKSNTYKGVNMKSSKVIHTKAWMWVGVSLPHVKMGATLL